MDSDNPTATWGGLLGFMYGHKKLCEHFGKTDFSDKYNIARTRVGFSDTSADQYDTYVSGGQNATQYIGYTFPTAKTFTKLVFQEGKHFEDGGWFSSGSLKVQVQNGVTWTDVTTTVSPAYPSGNDLATFGDDFQTFTFSLANEQGTGIRIIGSAGGSAQFISVAELQVFENTTNIASKGTIIATVTTPVGGSGSTDIQIIRDGKIISTGIDSFTALAERGLTIVERVITEQMKGKVNGDNWELSPSVPVINLSTPKSDTHSPLNVLVKGKTIQITFVNAGGDKRSLIQLFDLKGRVVIEKLATKNNNTIQLDAPLVGGLYFVKYGNLVSRIFIK